MIEHGPKAKWQCLRSCKVVLGRLGRWRCKWPVTIIDASIAWLALDMVSKAACKGLHEDLLGVEPQFTFRNVLFIFLRMENQHRTHINNCSRRDWRCGEYAAS